MSTATEPRSRTRTRKPAPVAVNPDDVSGIARDSAPTFKLASDETRLRLILMLTAGELHVTDLCKRLGQSQPAVSHHLALLRVAGIISARREGKHNFYGLEPLGQTLAAAAVSVVGKPEV